MEKENLEQYISDLRAGECEVIFTKKDGSQRNMRCTLNQNVIPTNHLIFSDRRSLTSENLQTTPLSYIRVFDVENQEWRTIIYDSITSFIPITEA